MLIKKFNSRLIARGISNRKYVRFVMFPQIAQAFDIVAIVSIF